MLDLFPEDDMRVWKIFVSCPVDCKDYNTFMSRLESAGEAFKWTDVTDTGDGFDAAIDKSDVLVVLSGLWNENRDLINKHIKYAKAFKKPVIVIRPYGVEEIPEELQEVATRVVGWNTACIVDAILLGINGDEYEFLM